MSMSSGHVRCHGCDFESVMQRRPITLEYELPNREVVIGFRLFAWCSSCETITEAETEFDTEQIRKEIDLLKKNTVGFFGRLLGGGKTDDFEMNVLQNRLQLSEIRQSKPRCLRCGNTTVIPLEFDENGTSKLTHKCGRRLFIVPEDSDAARFSYRPEVIRLDAEGQKI